MSRVADRMIEVMDQVDKMSKLNSQIFNEMKTLYGEESEEFKMIREIDSKIDDLLTHLNYDETEIDESYIDACGGSQVSHMDEDLNSEE